MIVLFFIMNCPISSDLRITVFLSHLKTSTFQEICQSGLNIKSVFLHPYQGDGPFQMHVSDDCYYTCTLEKLATVCSTLMRTQKISMLTAQMAQIRQPMLKIENDERKLAKWETLLLK